MIVRVLRAANAALQAYLAATWSYQLVVLTAAATGRRAGTVADGAAADPARLCVLVPAHDEEGGIAATVHSLLATDYAPDRRRVLVIADNCTDATAQVAAGAGAEVWERDAPDAPGKGPALAWALDRLLAEPGAPDAVVFVDADCVASPNLLAGIDAALAAGAEAVQVDYVVANPAESEVAALRYAGFRLVNTLRPMGLERLGLSVGLYGTGMAFRSSLLRDVPWSAFGMTEDREYHLELVERGHRVRFRADAAVHSPMPATFAASESQQLRWEAGNAGLVRTWAPRLVARGLRHRDPEALHAGAALLVAPQSLLAAAALASAGLSILTGRPGGARRAGAALVAQTAYVLGGLAVTRAPAEVYRALPAAARFVPRRLSLLGRIARGMRPATWQRTERP